MAQFTEENLQSYLAFTSFFRSSQVHSVPPFYTLPDGKLQLQNVPELTATMTEDKILRKLGAVPAQLRMHQSAALLPYLLVHREDTQKIVPYHPLTINPEVRRRPEGLAEVLYDLQQGKGDINSLVRDTPPVENSFNLKHFWVDLQEDGLQNTSTPLPGCQTTMYTTVPREKASWYVTFILRQQWIQKLPHLLRMELAYKIHPGNRRRDLEEIKITGHGYFKIEGASLSNLKFSARAAYFDFPEKRAKEGLILLPKGVVQREKYRYRRERFSGLDEVLAKLCEWMETPPEQVVQMVADLEYIF